MTILKSRIQKRNLLEISDSDKSSFTKFPKKLLSYIKTQKTENSSILPLRQNGLLKSLHQVNTLYQKFHKEFTPVTDNPIPDKGPRPHLQLKGINVQVSGVEKLLGNINPHKAKFPDEIHVRVLKECKHATAPILTIICKTSLLSGTIPSDWKHTSVCPVYKKGDTHNPKNYRPISLTCICCKLCEHIIGSSLIEHLENQISCMISNTGFGHLDPVKHNSSRSFKI